jgi:hypothetical protein
MMAKHSGTSRQAKARFPNRRPAYTKPNGAITPRRGPNIQAIPNWPKPLSAMRLRQDLSHCGLTKSRKTPRIGQAASAMPFIHQRIMGDRIVPQVPIFYNTFYSPNQPLARRCFDFGRSVARTIEAWDSDARVAIFGSGGMTHFVIDEEFDRFVLDCLDRRDAEALCSIPENVLQSGTSEFKNWIGAAGCLFETTLKGGTIAYEPCYRSEAGTGAANGFVAWT